MASEEKRSGISIQTLVISALAAVAAAVIVPMIWERGTLVATAMTPVIVALVSEGLSRPAERITAATKTVRRSATGAAVRDPDFDPLPPGEREVTVSEHDPFGLRGRPPIRRHHWWIALATGVAAFAVAVVALTMSELVLGGPATKEGGNTTFFSGSREESPTPTATPAATETPQPTETAEPTVTATPTATPTETPPPLEATPTPTPVP